MKQRIILAGDIGGTKTTLGVFNMTRGPRTPVVEATFPSASYPGLEVMVKEFLTKAREDFEAACFGVAGPVTGDKARITYQHKGRFGGMVAQMPVHIILNPKAALLGAARAGLHGF